MLGVVRRGGDISDGVISGGVLCGGVIVVEPFVLE